MSTGSIIKGKVVVVGPAGPAAAGEAAGSADAAAAIAAAAGEGGGGAVAGGGPGQPSVPLHHFSNPTKALIGTHAFSFAFIFTKQEPLPSKSIVSTIPVPPLSSILISPPDCSSHTY